VGELTLTIVAHALLGIALALFIWAVGAGWLRLLGRLAAEYAYPIGLLAVVAASWVVLVSAWLVPLSLVLVAPALLARFRLLPFLAASPFALGLGVAIGALLHGPTEKESSHAYTDMLVYAAKLASARESVLPFRELLVAGESSTYVEAGSTFVGAAIPSVDPILFQVATVPAFLVAALAPGFALLGARVAAWQAAALAPLAVAVVAYPVWITETPPVAFALPLAFSLYRLTTRPESPRNLAAAIVLVGLAFTLTKGFGLFCLAVASAFAFRRTRVERRHLLRYGLPALAVALAALGYFILTSAWLVDVIGLRFLPVEALDGLLDQFDRRDTQAASPAFLVIGEVLLTAALVRARAWPATAMVLTALGASWVVGGHSIDITVAIAVVFALVLFATRPDLLRSQLPLVVSAGAALAFSSFFRDIAGVRAGIVFGLLLAGAVLAALVPGRPALVVAAAVGVGVAAGYAGGTVAQGPVTLTPNDYDIWREVGVRVSENDLVFTTETGPALGDSTEGWNYYPGVAGRNVYVAGWSSSPLLVDDQQRARRLQLNRDVLIARRSPRAVAPDYERYFAVARRSEISGAGFRLLHANQTFALYEIP
jgi:hypothetical protein